MRQGEEGAALNLGSTHAAALVGYAALPADTLAAGPASGAFGARGCAARFSGQPGRGFSGVPFGPGDSDVFLSDSGFGSKANNVDYLLRLYRVILTARAGRPLQVRAAPGDKFGPSLLHFPADGKLLGASISTPNLAGLPALKGQVPPS